MVRVEIDINIMENIMDVDFLKTRNKATIWPKIWTYVKI